MRQPDISAAPVRIAGLAATMALLSLPAGHAWAQGSVSVTRMAGGEIQITCTGNPDLCDQRAQRLCSLGYEVTRREANPATPDQLTIRVRCD